MVFGTETARRVVDMAAHMPRIVDFWSTVIFHTGRYSGNAFRPHLAMPRLTAAPVRPPST